MLRNQELNNLFDLQVHDTAGKIIVFTQTSSSRLQYTLDFVFRQLGLRFEITNDETAYVNTEDAKINYSSKRFVSGLNVLPSGLLSETGIRAFKPEVKIHQDCFFLFPDHSDFGFDLFSAVFFMISRYEEWQCRQTDLHGRFEITESVLYQNSFHLKPVVDRWIHRLATELLKMNADLIFSERTFKTLATLDIDNLFAYRSKGLMRTAGAFARDLIKGDFSNAARRMRVLSKKEPDPFDIYESVSLFCREHSIPLICFFLMAQGNNFDRSVNPESKAFKGVFDTLLMNQAAIGIHPSYYCESRNLLNREKEFIESNIHKKIVFSRQHYLRFNIRTTPDYLQSAGVTHDFSMGFASSPGFRAGTSFPFQYYNLDRESASDLTMVPFCAMDGAYMVYSATNAAKALADMIELKKEVQQVNGFFITVFHERTFDSRVAAGYSEVFYRLMLS